MPLRHFTVLAGYLVYHSGYRRFAVSMVQDYENQTGIIDRIHSLSFRYGSLWAERSVVPAGKSEHDYDNSTRTAIDTR